YRALAWLALKEGVNIHDGPALAHLAQHAEIAISRPQINDGRQYTVTVRGQDVTWDIRSAPVTSAVSTTSAHKEVRAIMVAQQRAMAMAQEDGVVMVGRDIGAVVLPDAELKIYLTASLEERARRRYAELVERLEPPTNKRSRSGRLNLLKISMNPTSHHQYSMVPFAGWRSSFFMSHHVYACAASLICQKKVRSL